MMNNMIKKAFTYFLLLGILLSLCSCAQQETQTPSLVDAYLQAAQELIDKGDLDSAIAGLEEALSITNDPLLEAKLEEAQKLKQQHEETTTATSSTNDFTLYADTVEAVKQEYSDALYFCGYMLYDMSADSTPELIVKKGTCDADTQCDVYTIKDGVVTYCGNFFGVSICGLYGHEGILMVNGQQMMEQVTRCFIFDGIVMEEDVFSGAVEEYHPFTYLEWNNFDAPISLVWDQNPTDDNYTLYQQLKAGDTIPTEQTTPTVSAGNSEYTKFLGEWWGGSAYMILTEENGRLNVLLGVGTGFLYEKQLNIADAIQDGKLYISIDEPSYDASGTFIIEWLQTDGINQLYCTVIDNMPEKDALFMRAFKSNYMRQENIWTS